MTTEGAYRTVYKAVLMHPMQTVDMPVGSRVVTVETQGGQPCIWYECDPSAPSERRTFTAIGTGHLIPPGQEYVGTSHDVAGAGLVFHVYEQEPPTIGKGEQS